MDKVPTETAMVLSPKYRLSVPEAIREGKIRLNVCRPYDIDDFNIIKNTGQSPTIFITGRIPVLIRDRDTFKTINERVIIKVSNPLLDVFSNTGTRYELKIYKQVCNDAIKNRYTPNVIGTYGVGHCKGLLPRLVKRAKTPTMQQSLRNFIIARNKTYNNVIDGRRSEEYAKLLKLSRHLLQQQPGESYQDHILRTNRIRKEIQTIVKEEVKIQNISKQEDLNLLYLEMSNGTEMGQIQAEFDVADMKACMAQVIYTLMVFEHYKFVHNDMHTGNIMVDKLSSPVTLYYFIDEDRYFTVHTRYIPKIFDFNMGYMERLGPNDHLENDFCESIGICSRYHNKFDLYTFVAMLATMGSDSDVKRYCLGVFNKIVKNARLRKPMDLPFPFRLCDPVKGVDEYGDPKTTCKAGYYPTDAEMLPPSQALDVLKLDIHSYKQNPNVIPELTFALPHIKDVVFAKIRY